MPQIGVMITGAGVATPITGQNVCEQFLYIADVDSANVLQGLRVDYAGQTIFSIDNSPNIMAAIAKWQQEITGTAVGVLFKIATGKMFGNTTYRLVNNGATTPAIFAFSEPTGEGTPLYTTALTINPRSSQEFAKFSALFIEPANVASIELTGVNGQTETLSITDIDALFSLYNQAETDGRLSGISVLDNTEQKYEKVKIISNATAGGVVVAAIKLDDDVFKALKQIEG